MTFGDSAPRRSPLPLVLAAVVGLLAIIGTYLVLRPGGGDDEGSAQRSSAAREDCAPLVVSASSEKAGLLKELAERYNRAGRQVQGGACVEVRVSAKASGASTDALARGWDPAREGGPVPDVWSPASSSWVRLLQQRLAVRDSPALVPDGALPSLAQTPLVIAMPRPMAEALGWPDKPLGWGDVLGLTRDPRGWGAHGHPEWGRFKLGKTNPRFSTSGLNATVGTYFAATGRSSDLSARDVDDPKVAAYVKGVESGVVHYGDTTLTFLSNLAAADARGQGLTYISAVAVEEKSVYDYNRGNPTGDPALFGKGSRPRTPLVAIYPKEGTLVSDNPFVVLRTVSDDKRAGAADFLSYLREPAQQQRFAALAFRSFEGKAGGAVTRADGMLPDRKVATIAPPSPAVLQKVSDSWDRLRKRARVLLVLDVSGSMGAPVRGGQSRLELAKRAALSSLSQLAPDDEVGLWTFSTGRTLQEVPYTEQVPVGPLARTGARLRSVISALAPEGGTALYRTTRDARARVLAGYDPQRINAIVLLTDGKNEFPPDDDLDSLLSELDGESPETSVRVFPIAYGEEADLAVLRRMAAASRAVAYDASDPATIERVLAAVLSNF